MEQTFCGYYFKCQSDTQTLAVIPAVHGHSRSVQLITDDGAWCVTEQLTGSRFFTEGICLHLQGNGITAEGEVTFGQLTPLRYDIMGPFRYVPFLQCRHSVVSMCHSVDGRLTINGKDYIFHHARGYIEGDRGRSFPSHYVWTHSFFRDGSLMLSVADIPMAGFHFTGVIGVVWLRGKEYRIATYLGAKAVKIASGEVVIRQGDYTLSAKLLEKNSHPLCAPVQGSMVRIIHESASCRASYRFEKEGRTLLDFETDRASFEFEYGGTQ